MFFDGAKSTEEHREHRRAQKSIESTEEHREHREHREQAAARPLSRPRYQTEIKGAKHGS